MTERLDNHEATPTPVQVIWRTLGEIELLVHDGTIERHDPNERLSIEFVGLDWVLHRRDILYIRDETDPEQLYWPLLVKVDDGVEVNYQLLDDDEVMCGDDYEDEDSDTAALRMATELETVLLMMRQRPMDVTIYGNERE